MKTITKKHDVYSFDELDQKAKDKARNDYNKDGDNTPFLTDDLREYIHEELKERGYTVEGVSTSAKPSIRPLYSLSYCQGDGLMFEGTVSDSKGYTYTIKHSGHYYHENSKDITITDQNGNDVDGQVYQDFDAVYKEICKAVAQRGYDELEYADSEESFQQTCEANDYTFLADGTIFNE